MRGLKMLVLLALSHSVLMGAAFAQSRGTAEEAKAMAERGLAYIKEVGAEKAFAEFSDKDNGKWHEKDLYIYVRNFDGVAMAQGINKALIGKSLLSARDPNGKAFVKEAIEIAKTKGTGWVDFIFTDPITKKLMSKSSYTARIPGYDGYIGVGIYK